MEQCGECDGRCCRRYRVPITGADLRRLAAQGHNPDDIVDWVPVGTMYCTYPDVRIHNGYYYLVLSRRQDGSCILSEETGEGLRCKAHGSHPALCALYPHSFEGDLLKNRLCSKGIKAPKDVRARMDARDREAEDYTKKVTYWNSRRRDKRGPDEFIAYALD